jgi:hypothetical protein
LWLVDITEHWTGEGKLYLCAIKDCFSNKIVGYSIDSRMKARLAVNALNNAVARRANTGADVAGCIVHADRGSQFRSRKFHRALTRHGMVGSMGQVGSAADNAAMESFFSLLQKTVLDRQPWRTREDLRIRIVTWIERTYPAASTRRPRPIDPHRVRGDHDPNRYPGGLAEPVTSSCSRPPSVVVDLAHPVGSVAPAACPGQQIVYPRVGS